ncbi:MAG: hypothetical protein GF334_04210 [Candidatus Altiarchaeales archaeon]|nr:hypothetical protein [Candidatus Altiarchaeales archaeon]
MSRNLEETDGDGNVNSEEREYDTIAYLDDAVIETDHTHKYLLVPCKITVIAPVYLYYFAELAATNCSQVIVCSSMDKWKKVKKAVNNLPDDFPVDVGCALVPYEDHPDTFLAWASRYAAFVVRGDDDFRFLDKYAARYAGVEESVVK